MEQRIPRRDFAKKLASGAALLALGPSCTSASRSVSTGQLLRNDLRDLSGTLLFDETARSVAGDDFGHIVHRSPSSVLKPGSVQDIVKIVEFANRRGLKLATRGQGHAMFGQTQVDAGVVIDSSPLSSVRVIDFGGRPAVETGAGALWGQVVDATYEQKLTPSVNIDYRPLSVGGTISTAGFGGTTWREGFQVDHVLELQVVTGNGQLITCSDDNNSELFKAMLAGMGQCGIIVKVVMALVPSNTHVLFFMLSYDDLKSATTDLTSLVNGGRFHHLEGRIPKRPGGGFIYNIEAGVFCDAPNIPTEASLLSGLSFASRAANLMTYAQYHGRTPAPPSGAHPWLYLCLPEARFLEYAIGVLGSPAESAFAVGRFAAWRRSSIKRPLARVPGGDRVFRFNLLRNPPASADIALLVAMNRTLYERARDIGGTRMTSSAIPFSHSDWIQHYGPAWEQFRAAKQRFDPNNVLNPGAGIFPG